MALLPDSNPFRSDSPDFGILEPMESTVPADAAACSAKRKGAYGLLKPDIFEKIDAMRMAELDAAGPPGSLSRALFEHMKEWSLDARNLYPIHLPQLARQLAKKAESHLKPNNPNQEP